MSPLAQAGAVVAIVALAVGFAWAIAAGAARGERRHRELELDRQYQADAERYAAWLAEHDDLIAAHDAARTRYLKHLDRCHTCNYDTECMACNVLPVDDIAEADEPYHHSCNCQHARRRDGLTGYQIRLDYRIASAELTAHTYTSGDQP